MALTVRARCQWAARESPGGRAAPAALSAGRARVWRFSRAQHSRLSGWAPPLPAGPMPRVVPPDACVGDARRARSAAHPSVVLLLDFSGSLYAEGVTVGHRRHGEC